MKADQDHDLTLWQLLHEDWVTNGRDWTRPGFRALAVHRFGMWRLGIKSRLLRAPLSRLYLFLFRFVRNVYGIELPQKTKVGRRCLLAHQSGIVIHLNAEIGDDCIIRHNVTLGAATADQNLDAPKLGNNVQIGAGAAILGEVTIGDGARIGANTVVMTDVPAGASVFNSPSKIMKKAKTTSKSNNEEPALNGAPG